MEEGLAMVPQHEDYSGPGGWGYYTCAGDIIKSEKKEADIWHPAIGWARPPPKDIVDFIFVKARTMVERGCLVLIPASLIGCEFRCHGYLEKLLIQELLNANPIMIGISEEQPYITGFPVVVPYFLQAPLADIAKMVDDHGDILIKARKACLNWGKEVHKDSGELSAHEKQIISAEIKDAFAGIKNAFQKIRGKMPSSSPFSLTDEQITTSGIIAPTPKTVIFAGDTVSAGLYVALQENEKPWYPFWQLQSRIGGHWKIAGPKLLPPKRRKSGPEPIGISPPKTSTHWIQPPEGGWAIPTSRKFDF